MSKKKIDLLQTPVKNCFHHYLMPAIMGMVIKSLFIMGDTLIIGRGVGADGLGAVALAIPFFSIFTAIAMMIGIGGAAVMSMQFGKGEYEEGQTLLSQSLLITLLTASALAAISLLGLDQLLAFLGTSEHLAEQAGLYLSVMLKFFPLYALCWVLSCFVRNDTNPRLAMYAMSIAAIVNLVLDYIFIFHFGWGVEGAAVATGLSQILLLVMLVSHFFTGRGHLKARLTGLGFSKAPEIFAIGLPTFFIESTMAVTGVMFNYVLLRTGSDLYISAYSITLNVGVLVAFILMGIAQASQPIISFNFGAQSSRRIRETLLISLLYALSTAVISLGMILVSSVWIAEQFAINNPELAELAATALRYFFMAYPFMAVNLLVATLFQATGKPNKATLISILRGFVFVAIGLVTLPHWFPENGVWMCVLIAELLTSGLSLFYLKQFLNQKTDREVITV